MLGHVSPSPRAVADLERSAMADPRLFLVRREAEVAQLQQQHAELTARLAATA